MPCTGESLRLMPVPEPCWCWCSHLSALLSGYRVKDASGHGHDLLMAEKPRWQVVRWLSTCGNGAVEGAEECDDGAPKDGDGCDSHCRIESGWECSGSPSVCKHTGGCWAALLWHVRGQQPHVPPAQISNAHRPGCTLAGAAVGMAGHVQGRCLTICCCMPPAQVQHQHPGQGLRQPQDPPPAVAEAARHHTTRTVLISQSRAVAPVLATSWPSSWCCW